MCCSQSRNAAPLLPHSRRSRSARFALVSTNRCSDSGLNIISSLLLASRWRGARLFPDSFVSPLFGPLCRADVSSCGTAWHSTRVLVQSCAAAAGAVGTPTAATGHSCPVVQCFRSRCRQDAVPSAPLLLGEVSERGVSRGAPRRAGRQRHSGAGTARPQPQQGP